MTRCTGGSPRAGRWRRQPAARATCCTPRSASDSWPRHRRPHRCASPPENQDEAGCPTPKRLADTVADFEVTAEGTAVQLLSAGRPYSIPVLPAGAGCWATPAPRRRLPLSPRARPRRRPGRCPVMDPDQALRDLRAALTALRHAIDNDTGDVAGHASTVLDLFTGLDHWLTTAASYRPTGSRPPASTRPKGSDRDDRSRRHALIIPPVGPPHTQQIGSEDLTALQQLVGGLIE